ncbi:MAG TPA: protoporphyrinogen oxidase [Gemmatimonadaceae bacterium]
MRPHVAIVGGGIGGLAALEHLTRVAPWLQVTLLESGQRLGGHVRTERSGAFLMEAGPDVIVASKPAAAELARRVGLGDRLCGTKPGVHGAYILSGTRLVRMPEGITGLVPSRFAPFATTRLVSPLGKIRVAAEYFIPPRRDRTDESIEGFVTRRLGREMYQRLVEPLLSGISAGDGSRLSMEAMFPQLRSYEIEYGGLVKGMLAIKRKRRLAARADAAGAAAPLAGFLSLPNGLSELVDGVQREVRKREPSGKRVTIRIGARVERVERVTAGADDAGGYAIVLVGGERIGVDGVILATPAYVASGFLRALDDSLASRLAEIEYASTVTVSVAYPEAAVPRPLDATGYLVPRIYGRPVLACTWVSSKFEGRSPTGHALFRLFLGGAGRGSWAGSSDDELLVVVRHELRDVMGITIEPELVHINRFDRAMPQYHVGHLDRVAHIEALTARHTGLALAGAAYRGVGIPDCVTSGERAAGAVLAALAAQYPSDSGSWE